MDEKNRIEKLQLREYLLGLTTDEATLSSIEERQFRDEEFADAVYAAECELIDEYLSGELTPDEKRHFELYFMVSAERYAEIHLTQNLRLAATNRSAPADADGKEGTGGFFNFSWMRLAFAMGLLALAATGIWRFVIYKSDAEQGIAFLQKAFGGSRVLESRITILPDYVPLLVKRGPDVNGDVDRASRDRAERYLLDATVGEKSAAAHQALALLKLMEKEYDRAIEEMGFALAAEPENARILSDAGALYLELAKRTDAEKYPAKKLEYLNESLNYLDRAISLDAKLSEPRFNRALCLMELSIPERAVEAWKEYLTIDSDSRWADEARRHLEALEKQQPKELSATELETLFISAVNANDEARAAELIGTNRELIRDKYLPQRLAASYTRAPAARRDELLSALRYAGEIELKQTGDTFAKDIALFYSSLGEDKLAVLSRAHAEVRDGYAKCLNHQYGEALESFKAAKNKFDIAGDEWNAALSSYFVGYSLINIDNSDESLKVLLGVQRYAQQKGYLWLDATVSHWIAGANQKLERHASARLSYAHALEVAERIDDAFAAQRNLIELARLSAFVGQKDAALAYLSKMFQRFERQNNSQRQRCRNYAIAVEMLSRLRLYHVAKELSLASIMVSEDLEDKMWVSHSRSNAASIMIELGEVEKARLLIYDAKVAANDIADSATKRKFLSLAAAKSGELESKLGDHERARASYREAVSYYDSSEVPFYSEDSHTGLLASLMVFGQTSEIEAQIQNTLDLTESYRAQILDKEEQRDYFALRSNIYEMATAFEASRGNYEAAYNYAESSRARTLLDSLRADSEHVGSHLKYPYRPLTLAQIQAAVPDSVQLVQYTVLPKQLLIWVVTRDKFSQHSVEIDETEFGRDVDTFIKSISSAKSGGRTSAGRRLYDKLIKPASESLDSSKELAIIPHKMLFALPFAALISSDNRPLIEDFTITYSPSASVYIHCTLIAAEKNKLKDEAFLGVGDPAFDKKAFQDLPYLESAVDEVQTSAASYKSKTILTRENASVRSFLNAAPKADVIHFAGHYVVTPGDPMLSHMLFATNGGPPESCLLTNRDLSRHNLTRPRLIVLAACQTGVETVYGGEGMAGLASTFLAAKVPVVVASSWRVDSAATARLMKRFHEIRAESHLSTARALRQAQLEMIHDSSGTFSGPFYWAGFGVFGGHAEY